MKWSAILFECMCECVWYPIHCTKVHSHIVRVKCVNSTFVVPCKLTISVQCNWDAPCIAKESNRTEKKNSRYRFHAKILQMKGKNARTYYKWKSMWQKYLFLCLVYDGAPSVCLENIIIVCTFFWSIWCSCYSCCDVINFFSLLFIRR